MDFSTWLLFGASIFLWSATQSAQWSVTQGEQLTNLKDTEIEVSRVICSKPWQVEKYLASDLEEIRKKIWDNILIVCSWKNPISWKKELIIETSRKWVFRLIEGAWLNLELLIPIVNQR